MNPAAPHEPKQTTDRTKRAACTAINLPVYHTGTLHRVPDPPCGHTIPSCPDRENRPVLGPWRARRERSGDHIGRHVGVPVSDSAVTRPGRNVQATPMQIRSLSPENRRLYSLELSRRAASPLASAQWQWRRGAGTRTARGALRDTGRRPNQPKTQTRGRDPVTRPLRMRTGFRAHTRHGGLNKALNKIPNNGGS